MFKNLIAGVLLFASGIGLQAVAQSTRVQILHASDFEAGISAPANAPNFAAIIDTLEGTFPNTLILSSGDNFIPSPFSFSGEDPSLVNIFKNTYNTWYGATYTGGAYDLRAGIGRADISILNFIGIEASVLGNHEFDLGTSELANIITGVRSGTGLRWYGAQFPYLSANLNFSADANLSAFFESGRRLNTFFRSNPTQSAATIAANKKLAPVTIIQKNGIKYGIVGVTTPILAAISSPGATSVMNPGAGGNNMQLLASILQPHIDSLRFVEGINKIIVLAHLQQLSLEKQLAQHLKGVDIIIAGGSHTLMADAQDRLRTGDVAIETYPFFTTDSDGKPTVIVNTESEYKYVGRLVIDFDSNDEIVPSSVIATESGAFATDSQGVSDLWGAALPQAFASGTKGGLVKTIADAITLVIQAKDGNVFGKSSVYLQGLRNFVRTEETNLGNLTADANLWQARQAYPNVQISWKNGGGIRSSMGVVNAVGSTVTYLPTAANPLSGKNAGDISQLDVENSLRFNNRLSVLNLTATNLKTIMEHGFAASGPGQTQGRFPQIAGVKIRFNLNLPANSRVIEAAIVDSNGNPIDTLVYKGAVYGNPTRQIRIVTLNFLAGGGDGYPFNTLGTNRMDLDTALASTPGQATFAVPGSEQDAFAEFMKLKYNTTPYNVAETNVNNDWRLQQIHENTQACIFAPENPVVQLVSGSLCGCPSNSSITFKTDTVYNALSYLWQVKSGNGIVNSGANQKQAAFNFNPNALLAEVSLTASNNCGSSKEVSGAFPDVSIWNGETWSKGTPDNTKDAILADRISTARGFSTLDSFAVRNLYISNGNEAILPFGCDIYGDIINLNNGYNSVAVARIMGTDTTEIKGVPFHFGGGSLLVKPGAVLKTNDKLIYGYKSDTENGAISGLAFGFGTPGGGGQIIGNVSLRRKGIPSNLQLEFWSSPVSGATTSVLGNRDIRSFNATNQTWTPSGFGQSLPGTTPMLVGSGYTATNPGVVNFFGAPNNGPYGLLLTQNGGSNDDWNFVGNPYPSVLNLEQFINDNAANFNGSIYKWEKPFISGLNSNNFSGSDYTVYNLLNNFNVNVMEGFFVEATGTSLNFNNNQRYNDAAAAGFRTTSTATKIRLAITNTQNEGRSTLIGFTTQASNGYDLGYDAKYLNGYTNLGISSLLNNDKMAIQAFGPLTGSKIVDLELHSNNTGTHTISIDTLENVDPNTTLFLEDLSTSQMHNLQLSGYTFQVNQTGAISGRFKLHINSLTTSTPVVEKAKPVIFAHENRVILNGLDADTKYYFRIFDLSGRQLTNELLSSGSSKAEFSPMVSEGTYLIQLHSLDGQTLVNQKVVIKK